MSAKRTATALVVDDSPTQAIELQLRLTRAGFEVRTAGGCIEAMTLLEQARPDIVLTDLEMPELDGLELVQRIRAKYPGLPVILLTAFGSEETAAKALKHGAAGYVPKRLFDRDLNRTLDEVLSISRANQTRTQVAESLARAATTYRLNNDPSLIPVLVSQLQESLSRYGICDQNDGLRVAMALREALLNAVEHGNLEVSSALRENLDDSYHNLTEERRRQKPYCDRCVQVEVTETREEARYVIADEGPGFDPSKLPDPTDPANLEKASGRGLLLMRSFMDEVFYNDRGNQITLVKRRKSDAG